MHRWLSSVVIAAFAAAVIPTAFVVAQTGTSTAAKPAPAKQTAPAKQATPAKATTPTKAWSVPKTPWGDPDLQGVWNDATSTPLQRPGGIGDQQVLRDEEGAGCQDDLAYNLTRDRRDGGPEVDVNRAYNEHWMDARRLKITA